ncbi:hypothetical protein, partial [Serratia marcescens]|uniref:hypothetical protein n=1 Tax=Serratia marcescens TaxID=615 RepID=UPI001C37CFBF
MLLPFIELCIASGSLIRKTEYSPPRRISNVLPDIHPVMSIIDKKRKQKAAQPGYANSALLLFRAVMV